MSKPSKQIVIPLTRDELDKLDFEDVIPTGKEFGGAFASSFDVKRGVERWIKAGCPSVLDKSEFAKMMEIRHQSFVNKLSVQHEDEISLHISTSEKEVNALRSKLSESAAAGLNQGYELGKQSEDYKAQLTTKEYEIEGVKKSASEMEDSLRRNYNAIDNQNRIYKERLTGNWFRRCIVSLFGI